MTNDDWRWYCLIVTPGREIELMDRLNDLNAFPGLWAFAAIRHRLRKPRDRSRRQDLVARAQIPGYLVLAVEPQLCPAWKAIRELDGILGVLGADGRPQPVHEPSLIAHLAGSHRPIAYVNLPRRRKRCKGQRTAEIVSGPYQGRTVRIVEVADHDPDIYELLER
jgi:transcription antitermination factor NusG